MMDQYCYRVHDRLEMVVEKFFDITYANGYRVDIDAQDAWGQTPLHLALANKCKKVAELLLEYGADPNLANAEGLTSLHYICQLDQHDQSIELLNAFFDISDAYHRIDLEVDAQDKLNRTPLRLASLNGNYKMSKLLLKRGADLNLAGLNQWQERLIETEG
ncbi:E3 ubiquitin-protein ligase HACE1-like [Trichogramma pretiosum]|uniref:E3 ubiquitin-protein ligase HACE1-like n=1 Tax=Trichogramma pretiosum TaxID=7493 RepID=UPI0006C9467A|nr:E3 ubiquitin-protein ligase HACE1-like [Trichogramma pretiosum]